MARKLKVFQAQFGFYDTVVAAPSRAAALRAWGTHQDLFANGEAKETTDPKVVAAATAHPETPLRRAVGSTEPFALEPTSLPKVPDAPKRKLAKPAAKAQPPASAKPAVDRSALESAEQALRELDDDRKRQEAAFRREHAELEVREGAAQEEYVNRRRSATAAIVEARKTYRSARGEA